MAETVKSPNSGQCSDSEEILEPGPYSSRNFGGNRAEFLRSAYRRMSKYLAHSSSGNGSNGVSSNETSNLDSVSITNKVITSKFIMPLSSSKIIDSFKSREADVAINSIRPHAVTGQGRARATASIFEIEWRAARALHNNVTLASGPAARPYLARPRHIESGISALMVTTVSMEQRHETSTVDPGVSVSAASPGKRRGFSGRRWLGLKGKPSQGKADKAPGGAQSPAATEKPVQLKKIPSEKKLRLPYVNDNGREEGSEGPQGGAAALDEAEDDAPDVELPPPMKPIQDPQSVLQQAPTPAAVASAPTTRNSLALDVLDSNGGPADIAEIEQIVKEKMEQHGGAGACSGASGGTNGGEDEEPVTPGPDSAEAILKKREYVLRELVDTEEIYVSDLRLVCDGYMRHMADPSADPPLPEGLRDRRHRMIFGNIEAIYEWHRDKFLRELQACMKSPELLGPLFRRFLEKRMFLYEAYCRNKPVSEYIVSEHDHYFQELRHKLGHKLQLGDLLIKPIQRIQKYHLLVKKILAYSESANAPDNVISALEEAVLCTSIIPKNANDMMDVGRLQGFTGNITAQGKLLMQEPLVVSDATSNDKGKELHVFLFEQCVIFSEAVGKKNQFTSPTYNYKAHVQVNKMELEELENNGAFIIHSLDPNKPKQSFMCRAPEARRAQWTSTLSTILRSQRIFGEALENPGAYLRELHRDQARDPAAVGEGWSGLRKTESVPPCLGGRLAPELRGRSQRPHTKANTINLPTGTVRSDDRKKTPSTAVSPTSPPHANV
ncbi:unnamed protein product [Parnassius apollo]|uniref:(apollo) hypothetical protein n=1 Tax=Parnassius apollo TaxID=110799 RepID=A0A8S3WWR3_PARAO|nr:unnamed protein product [Parnassius apollo]